MEQIGITYPSGKQNNTVGRGTIGLAKAISFFCSKHYIVSLPVSDNQPYDLIVDDGNKVSKVEIKTSTAVSKKGDNVVTLKKCRHNKTRNKITPISAKDCDLIFVYTSAGETYLFPSDVLDNMHGITLSKKYTQYRAEEEVLSNG